MSRLRRVPPKSVLAQLEGHSTTLDDIRISLATDINSSGEYDVQWLIATSDTLFVFDPELTNEPLFRFELGRIEDLRTAAAIGSGILQIRLDAVWLDLLRFSNRNKYDFDRALKRLRQLKNRQPMVPFEADERDPQRCPTCELMLEFPGELCPRCIDQGAALGRVARLMRPYWKAAAVLLVFLIIGIALDMAWPLLTRYLVDSVLATSAPQKAPAFQFLKSLDAKSALIWIVAVLGLIHIARAIVNVITARIGGRVGNAMTFDIRAKLLAKLQELGLAYYSKQETGSLVGRIAYDTDSIYSFISQITSGFLMQFFLVIISFLMMFSLEPSLALWAMVPAPLVIAGAVAYWRYVHPRFQRYWDRSSKQAGVLNGILAGIRVVKAFAQEDNEYERFQKSSMRVRKSRENLDLTAAYFYPIMGLVFQVGGWIIWYIGGQHVLQNKISLGTLMAFFGYLSMFYGPLGNLTNLTTWLTQFSTQIHRIFEILDTPTVLPSSAEPEPVPLALGQIEFNDVTFGYSRGVPVIKNMSLKIRSGERIGIVGRSGSGKTSIINLICRFYDVDSGNILLDGVDIRKISKEDLRSRISVVLQEPFLFQGTLRENIIYGKPQATIEEILRASRSAAAHEFVMTHPLAYDTAVGERGQELSGGERQRISIARALLCRPPILILDEATSSIDSESELMIQNALEEIARNRTTITIAHRLSTLQRCDRIYVIENGQIVESGTHKQLMKNEGRYANWIRIQQGQSYVEMDVEGNPISRKKNLDDQAPGLLPAIEGHEPRYLRPGIDTLERGLRHELQLKIPGERLYRGVFAIRCFPVHHPDHYVSLRSITSENRVQELGIIKNIAEWPPAMQSLIRESLGRRYFFHTIHRIHSIRKVSQFLSFTAQTDLGKIDFIIRHHQDSAQEFGKHGRLLTDVEDNLYIIRDLGELKRSERELFDRHIYW